MSVNQVGLLWSLLYNQSFPAQYLDVSFFEVNKMKLQLVSLLLERNWKTLCPEDFPELENFKEQLYLWLLQKNNTLETPSKNNAWQKTSL